MDGKKIIKLVVAFIMINAVLWLGQEIYYWDEEKEIKQIENNLDIEQVEISELEEEIMDRQEQIELKKIELNNLKSSGSITDYNNQVDYYNTLLNDYKSSLDMYESKLAGFNNQVDKINELIKDSGSRWYLIPVPLPGKSARSKL